MNPISFLHLGKIFHAVRKSRAVGVRKILIRNDRTVFSHSVVGKNLLDDRGLAVGAVRKRVDWRHHREQGKAGKDDGKDHISLKRQERHQNSRGDRKDTEQDDEIAAVYKTLLRDFEEQHRHLIQGDQDHQLRQNQPEKKRYPVVDSADQYVEKNNRYTIRENHRPQEIHLIARRDCLDQIRDQNKRIEHGERYQNV